MKNLITLTEKEVLELAKEALLLKWASETEKFEKSDRKDMIAKHREAVYWDQSKEIEAIIHGVESEEDTLEDEVTIEAAASEATGKWETMFHEALHSGIATRRRNMEDDIRAGYNPKGHNIELQKQEISEYIHAYAEEVRRIAEKTPRARETYCRSYLKVHGWIE